MVFLVNVFIWWKILLWKKCISRVVICLFGIIIGFNEVSLLFCKLLRWFLIFSKLILLMYGDKF